MGARIETLQHHNFSYKYLPVNTEHLCESLKTA